MARVITIFRHCNLALWVMSCWDPIRWRDRWQGTDVNEESWDAAVYSWVELLNMGKQVLLTQGTWSRMESLAHGQQTGIFDLLTCFRWFILIFVANTSSAISNFASEIFCMHMCSWGCDWIFNNSVYKRMKKKGK